MRVAWLMLAGMVLAASAAEKPGAPKKEQVDAFIKEFNATLMGMDYGAFKRLHHTEGMPGYLSVDTWVPTSTLLSWTKVYGNKPRTHGYEARFLTVEETKASPYADMIPARQGETVNGMRTSPNLPVVGYALIRSWEGEKPERDNQGSFIIKSVGMLPDGTLRFPGWKIEGEPTVKPQPEPPPKMLPQAITQEELDRFYAAYRHAYSEQGGWRDRVALYELRGLKRDWHRHIVGECEKPFSHHRTVERIELMTKEEFRKRLREKAYPQKQFFEGYLTGNYFAGGMVYNLPIVGILQIKYADADQPGYLPVGMDEKATLKLTSPIDRKEKED